MTAMVVNLRQEDYDVYIGRPGPWGNPYSVRHPGDRERVLTLYRRYMRARLGREPDLRVLLEGLRGKRLGCFCKPLACHGDVLLELLGREP